MYMFICKLSWDVTHGNTCQECSEGADGAAHTSKADVLGQPGFTKWSMNTMPASLVILPVVKVHFPCFMHHLTLSALGSSHESLDTNVKEKIIYNNVV